MISLDRNLLFVLSFFFYKITLVSIKQNKIVLVSINNKFIVYIYLYIYIFIVYIYLYIFIIIVYNSNKEFILTFNQLRWPLRTVTSDQIVCSNSDMAEYVT